MTDERYQSGMLIRRAVLGEEHVDRAQAGTTEFTRDFQEFITRYAWGEVWSRPGLDRKTRSMLTIAITAALGRWEELRLHVRGSRNTGATREEVREVLMQLAIYAGVPAANTAFAHASAVYQEMDEDDPSLG
jgi:4-carboxymuconolactone decarboxylase